MPEGRAEVQRNGVVIGMTPYTLYEPPGTHVNLQLKQKGYKEAVVSFEVNEVRKYYAYSMEKESETHTVR